MLTHHCCLHTSWCHSCTCTWIMEVIFAKSKQVIPRFLHFSFSPLCYVFSMQPLMHELASPVIWHCVSSMLVSRMCGAVSLCGVVLCLPALRSSSAPRIPAKWGKNSHSLCASIRASIRCAFFIVDHTYHTHSHTHDSTSQFSTTTQKVDSRSEKSVPENPAQKHEPAVTKGLAIHAICKKEAVCSL